jgi:type III restriction enzyme
VIHTDSAGEITKRDLEKAREAARDIDRSDNRIKVIVSVMMLCEGWDVRNVTVVLGLPPSAPRPRYSPNR